MLVSDEVWAYVCGDIRFFSSIYCFYVRPCGRFYLFRIRNHFHGVSDFLRNRKIRANISKISHADMVNLVSFDIFRSRNRRVYLQTLSYRGIVWLISNIPMTSIVFASVSFCSVIYIMCDSFMIWVIFSKSRSSQLSKLL